MLKVTVRVGNTEIFYGPGVEELLELIEQCGSVKDACREMGLSYTKGWRMINRMEEQLCYPVIVRRHGGKSGGGSMLTREGRAFMEKYSALNKAIKNFAQEEYDKLFSL